MRVTSVVVQNSKGDNVMTLSFRDPDSLNPYIVKAIVGLDGDEIIPQFYGTSETGQRYFSPYLQSRQIIMRVALNPAFTQGSTYSDLRDEVYKAIAASRTGSVRVVFMDGETEVAHIQGFVVKLESPHFNKLPEVQITLRCDDPVLRSPTQVVYDVDFLDHTDIIVDDDISTAPHGFRFVYTFDSEVTEFTIGDPLNEWEFKLNNIYAGLELNFQSGDQLVVSSETGNRYVNVIKDGTTHPIAQNIVPGSIWPIIFPGENEFVVSSGGEFTAILYYPTFWGV